MTCPCCGNTAGSRLSILDGLFAQGWKVIGAIAFVCTAILGQSHLVGEPYQHVLSITGTIAGALVAWNIKQHPVAKDTP